jgi:hypothetical protein
MHLRRLLSTPLGTIDGNRHNPHDRLNRNNRKNESKAKFELLAMLSISSLVFEDNALTLRADTQLTLPVGIQVFRFNSLRERPPGMMKIR